MNHISILALFVLIALFASGCDEDNLPTDFVDNIPPQASIVTPLDDAFVSGEVEIIAVADDEHSDVSEIQLFVDDIQVESATNDTLIYTWDTSALENDSDHTIQATATDSEGNTGESSKFTVTVKDMPPVVTIVTPLNNANISGVVDVLATAEDDQGQVVNMQLAIDSNVTHTVQNDTLHYHWDTTALESGEHTILVSATDSGENVGQSALRTVFVDIIDTEPPVISITSPTNGTEVNGVVAIEADASDNIGVSRVTFHIDDQLIFDDDQEPWVYEWDTTSLEEGSAHTIYATAIDGADNQSSTETISVTVASEVWTSRIVLNEMFTGTWCVPCNEFADPAIDSLTNLYGPTQLVSIQYHYGPGGDPWHNSGSENRLMYYGATTNFPVTYFDGGYETIGAEDDGIFDIYQNHIENSLLVNPEVGFALLSGELGDESVQVRIKALTGLSGMNLKLRGTVNENGLTYNEHHYNHVVRYFVPDQELSLLNPDDTQDVTVNFVIEDDWVSSNLELILFVQDDVTLLVLQAFILTE